MHAKHTSEVLSLLSTADASWPTKYNIDNHDQKTNSYSKILTCWRSNFLLWLRFRLFTKISPWPKTDLYLIRTGTQSLKVISTFVSTIIYVKILTCIYQGSINRKSLLFRCCIVKGEPTVLIYANALNNFKISVKFLIFINKQIVNYFIKNTRPWTIRSSPVGQQLNYYSPLAQHRKTGWPALDTF